MGFKPIYLLAILQLIVGIASIIVVVFLNKYGTYPQELSILHYQMACAAAGFISILLSGESAFFMSQEKRGVRNTYVFDIILSILLVIALVVTAINFGDVYLGVIIMGSGLELWDTTVLDYFNASYTLGLIACGFLFGSLLLLGFLLHQHIKKK